MSTRYMLYEDIVEKNGHTLDKEIWGFYKTKEALMEARHKLIESVRNRDYTGREHISYIVGFQSVDWED